MSKRSPETAVVTQTLLWVDGPEIVLLKKSAKEFILAVATPEPVEGLPGEDHFVGSTLTEKNIIDYQEEKCDLRFAMSQASYGRFWAFAFDGVNATVELSRYSNTSEIVRQSLPDSGFFARSHDRIKIVDEYVSDVDAQFEIDGSWDLGEFSSFYGKMEDIYYIANDIQRFSDGRTSPKVKSSIQEAFKKPWHGGGSYLSYYKSIANDNAPTARLKVGGIQYNSPGFVRLKAKRRPFNEMIAMLQSYSENVHDIKLAYSQLHKYLSSHALLKASADTDLKPVTKDLIRKYAQKLSDQSDLVPFDTLYSMTEENVLVAAKVQLSIVRRVQKLYEFFEQGRVSYDDVQADPLISE